MPCDFSLEAYYREDARQGEEYTLHRFPSGTLGFVKPEDTSVACCMKPGTVLIVSVQDREPESAEFKRLEFPVRGHYDGVFLSQRGPMSLQDLPVGTKATVVLLAGAKAPEDADLASHALPAAIPDALQTIAEVLG